jgi:hypothetical protein
MGVEGKGTTEDEGWRVADGSRWSRSKIRVIQAIRGDEFVPWLVCGDRLSDMIAGEVGGYNQADQKATVAGALSPLLPGLKLFGFKE